MTSDIVGLTVEQIILRSGVPVPNSEGRGRVALGLLSRARTLRATPVRVLAMLTLGPRCAVSIHTPRGSVSAK